MKLIRNFSLTVTLLLTTLSLPACASTSGEPLEGRVLEYGTDKPILNVIVVGRWQKGYLHSTACVHAETTTTDQQGRFRLPRYKGKTAHNVDVYAPGYEHFLIQGREGADYTRRYMKPFVGGMRERLEYLTKVRRTTGCHSAGRSERNLLPLREAIYVEAKQLAQSKDDQQTLEDFLYSKEMIEFGYETAQKRHLERLGAQK